MRSMYAGQFANLSGPVGDGTGVGEAGVAVDIAPEAGPSPQTAIEYTLHRALEEINTLVAFSLNDETAPLVEKEIRSVGTLMTRTQLLVSSLLARQARPRMVSGTGLVGR